MLNLKFLTKFLSLKISNEVYLDNRMKFFIGWLSIFLLLIVLSGCSTNPATGEKIFTGLMTKEQEIHQGRKTHPKVVKSFGGQYGSTSLQNYIKSIGHRLTQTVERRNLIYTFTILDLKVVNAFALPGGYVYVTRGLLALAENEAEVAGVLAHELGHINALHHAQRRGQSLLAGIIVSGIHVNKGSGARQLGEFIATGALRSYSRSHELEADNLALRYMSRAGYDPKTMVQFIGKLRANSRLNAKKYGKSPDKIDEFNYLSTHPVPKQRLKQIGKLLSQYQIKRSVRAREIYLQKIDGMVFGGSPKQGFIRHQEFWHPELKFYFKVPKNFTLFNSPNLVYAKGPNGASITLSVARNPTDGPMTFYIKEIWGRNFNFKNLEKLNINDLEAATGTIHHRGKNIRCVAIRKDLNTIYRFTFKTKPPQTNRLAIPFRRTTYSFRLLKNAEAKNLKPFRVKIIKSQKHDTVKSLARRMISHDNFTVERFRVLNGLLGQLQISHGQSVKIISY